MDYKDQVLQELRLQRWCHAWALSWTISESNSVTFRPQFPRRPRPQIRTSFAASKTYSQELAHSELQDAHHGCVNTQIVSPRLHRYCDRAHGGVRSLGPSEPLRSR